MSSIILAPLTSSHRSLEPVVCCAFGLQKGSSPLYPCVVPLGNDSMQVVQHWVRSGPWFMMGPILSSDEAQLSCQALVVPQDRILPCALPVVDELQSVLRYVAQTIIAVSLGRLFMVSGGVRRCSPSDHSVSGPRCLRSLRHIA